MLKDITLGQFYPTDSILHKLDPRVKLFGTIVYIVTLFLAKNPIVYFLAGLFLIIMIRLSKVPVRFMVRGLKSIVFLLLFTVIFDLFTIKGVTLVKIWKLRITYEGLYQAIYMTLRMIMLILGTSVMTLTTTPGRLADGLEKALRPLNLIKIPVHEMSMIISIALRFIPILMEEADKIMKAQTARGADFESGNFFKRVKKLLPIVIPLFVSAIRRASELAMAMEARCYTGGKGRTKMKPLKYVLRDYVAYIIILSYLAMIIVGKIFWNRYC